MWGLRRGKRIRKHMGGEDGGRRAARSVPAAGELPAMFTLWLGK
jgi:hypothetical protein